MSTPPILRATAPDVLGTPDASAFDALVVLVPSPLADNIAGLPAPVKAAIAAALAIDVKLGRGAHGPVVLPAAGVPGGRLVLAPVASLMDDIDDVRLVAEAAAAAVARAVEAGAESPLLYVSAAEQAKYAKATEVAALAALGRQWVPLEAREAGKAPRVAKSLGVVGLDAARAEQLSALELGRSLGRDITGTEPERMSPLRVAELCQEAFAGTGVTVEVETDVSAYPLMAAVARASQTVPRHRPCVIKLDYTPAGEIRHTMLVIGKGVTYDTGGADLKTNGHMAGMSRDKGGAGAAAGLVRAVAALKLPGVRVVALLGMVRNSIGEESFVSDEVIRAHSGVRVRIGNTDAEGRLVLADLLSHARGLAVGAPDPVLVSLATLTGHVYRAFGPYTGMIGNAPARSRGVFEQLDTLGEQWGEPFEKSRPRREDYAMVAARGSTEDVVSANRLASVDTARGHQLPYAFLDIASGLRGGDIPFIHLDVGGSAIENADWQFGRPTSTPILSLAALLSRASS